MTVQLCSDCLANKEIMDECTIGLGQLYAAKANEEEDLANIGSTITALLNEQQQVSDHLVELLQVPTDERDEDWENDLLATQNRANAIVGELVDARQEQEYIITNINGIIRMIEYTQARRAAAIMAILQCTVCN